MLLKMLSVSTILILATACSSPVENKRAIASSFVYPKGWPKPVFEEYTQVEFDNPSIENLIKNTKLFLKGTNIASKPQPVEFYTIDKLVDGNLRTTFPGIVGIFKDETSEKVVVQFAVLFSDNGTPKKVYNLLDKNKLDGYTSCKPFHYILTEPGLYNICYNVKEMQTPPTAQSIWQLRDEVVTSFISSLKDKQLLSGFERISISAEPFATSIRPMCFGVMLGKYFHDEQISNALKSLKVNGVESFRFDAWNIGYSSVGQVKPYWDREPEKMATCKLIK